MRKIETILAQAGRAPVRQFGAVNPPLKRCSTILHETVGAKRARGQRADLAPVELYGMMGNETHFALEAALAELEGGTHTQVTASGLSAITVPLLAYLKAGDHLLVTDSVYGPTRSFCDSTLRRFGVETTYYDPMITAPELEKLFQPNTRVLFTESPGSHTFEIQDIPALAAVAHAHGAKVFMDNTWGVLNFAPFTHGVDVSIQALTKYVGGHSDIILGAVTVNSEEDWRWLRLGALEQGNYASPDDCWLALRGLRTLKLRLKAAEEAGLHAAKWFAQQPEVARVLHPALPSCPGHEIYKRDFTGGCGLFGVVFQPHFTEADVERMIDALTMFGIGASWGGYESLALPSTGFLSRSVKEAIFEGPAARFQIGMENLEDLLADLQQALPKLHQP